MPIVLGAIGVLTLLFVAVVAIRLARNDDIPHPPIGLDSLGPLPTSSALDVTAREASRLTATRGPPGPEVVHDRFLEATADDALVLDDALRTAMASIPPTQRDDRARLVDAIYSGAPMEDRCNDLDASRCVGIEIMRAAQSAELVALDRWLAGDREGAGLLLTRMLVASLELARTGRAAMSQLVAIAALLRATGLAVILQRDGLVFDAALTAALEAVLATEIDLGRGWIMEMHRAEHALRTIPPGGTVERLALDRGSLARAVYAGQEACVRYARDPSAPRPTTLPLPASDDTLISSDTELAILDAIVPDCAQLIDGARTRTTRVHARARLALGRP